MIKKICSYVRRLAEACSCVHGFKDLKGSAAECADQNCDFVKSLIKHSSMDVAPTLGVNHVISGVVVFVLFCYVLYALINIYI